MKRRRSRKRPARLRQNRHYDKAYMKVRAYVRKRDRYKCQFLGCTNKATQVHHIIRHADRPMLRANKLNLISLCKKCHDSIKDKEKRFAPIFLMRVMNNEREYRELYGDEEDETEDTD